MRHDRYEDPYRQNNWGQTAGAPSVACLYKPCTTCTVIFQSLRSPWEKLGTASVSIIPPSVHESNYVIALRAFKSICFENNYIMPLTTSPWRCGIQLANAVS